MPRASISALIALLVGCGAPASPRSAQPARGRGSSETQTRGPSPAETISASDAAPDEATPTPAPDDPEVAALTEALLARFTVWTRPTGARVLSRRCREGPVECEARLAAFAALIVQSARLHELDPFLLAALAMRESGLDPAALGRHREAGIVQLHPRGAGRDMRFVQDAAYRARCQAQIDACQGPVLDRGASYLADGIRECGGVVAGLGRFASGHCTERGVHPRRVLAERDQLRALAQSAAAPTP